LWGFVHQFRALVCTQELPNGEAISESLPQRPAKSSIPRKQIIPPAITIIQMVFDLFGALRYGDSLICDDESRHCEDFKKIGTGKRRVVMANAD
jgi:hypothetical protein